MCMVCILVSKQNIFIHIVRYKSASLHLLYFFRYFYVDCFHINSFCITSQNPFKHKQKRLFPHCEGKQCWDTGLSSAAISACAHPCSCPAEQAGAAFCTQVCAAGPKFILGTRTLKSLFCSGWNKTNQIQFKERTYLFQHNTIIILFSADLQVLDHVLPEVSCNIASSWAATKGLALYLLDLHRASTRCSQALAGVGWT